jgi:HPt (histidine-containing phosphotransfer) domain-containing protein
MSDRSGDDSGKFFDRDDLLSRLGGDPGVVEAVVHVFREDSPRQLERLRRAVLERDCGAVATLAHALKGAAANLSAGPLRKAFLELEQAGARGDIEAISELMEAVEHEFVRLIEEIDK